MQPLFILAFDHRATFAKQLLGLPYPRLTSTQKQKVVELKKIVFEGFLHARKDLGNLRACALLIDEEFGTPIIRTAKGKRLSFAVSTEQSGQELFAFEYGTQFRAHLEKIKPTFAKALVRYNIQQKEDNKVQCARLKLLSDFCKKKQMGFILEILLTGRGPHLTQLSRTMKEILAQGVRPSVWKIEGLATPSAWRRTRTLTRAPIIALGRGEEEDRVESLLKIAAKSGVAQGFAIGRTIFAEPLERYLKKMIDRHTAIHEIAKNYLHFIQLWRILAHRT